MEADLPEKVQTVLVSLPWKGVDDEKDLSWGWAMGKGGSFERILCLFSFCFSVIFVFLGV